MNRRISTTVAAGALLLSAAGASFLIPNLVAAADPSAAPAATQSATSGTSNSSGSSSSQASPSTANPAIGDCANGGHRGPGGLDADDLTAAAKALGITEAQLTTDLQNGQSAADVAAAQNVDVQAVIDAIVASDKAEIQAAVDAGTMTQAQADQRLANLTAHVTDEVNGVVGPGMPGMDGPGRHGQPPSDSNAPTTDTTTTSTGTTS